MNLIGEHTDYSGGLVLPAAIAFGVTIRGRRAERIELRSQALAGQVELDPDGAARGDPPEWGRYAAAVASLLGEQGRPAVGLRAEIESTVPIGAGLSSSAALSVALALALCRVAAFTLPPLELARLAQAAELRAVGVPCGLMDPAASLLAEHGHALLLDCGHECWRAVRLPSELAIVVLDSGIRHALETSAYATRRDELERALAALGGRRPADLSPREADDMARAAGVDETALRRLRHVVSENERVRELVDALEAPGPLARAHVGAIMRAGHESQRDDFEVSTPELDELVELAYAHGAIGARLTGGGFGGSVVALVDVGEADRLAAEICLAYSRSTGKPGRGWVCATADGAGDLAARGS